MHDLWMNITKYYYMVVIWMPIPIEHSLKCEVAYKQISVCKAVNVICIIWVVLERTFSNFLICGLPRGHICIQHDLWGEVLYKCSFVDIDTKNAPGFSWTIVCEDKWAFVYVCIWETVC